MFLSFLFIFTLLRSLFIKFFFLIASMKFYDHRYVFMLSIYYILWPLDYCDIRFFSLQGPIFTPLGGDAAYTGNACPKQCNLVLPIFELYMNEIKQNMFCLRFLHLVAHCFITFYHYHSSPFY